MKYIVDIDEFEPHFKVDSIGVFGIGKSLAYKDEDHSWSRIKSVDEFEQLTADYVNEHFGVLQDDAYNAGLERGKKEAYQKGFDDGKWKSEDGCTGCKYEGKTGEHLPCDYCMNNFKNQWTAKQTDDKIEVGDVVERYIDGKFDSKGIYLNDADEKGAYWNCLFWTGACFVTLGYPKNQFKKTGRHFDIKGILEAIHG